MSNHNEAGSPTRRDEGSSAGCLALQSGEEVTVCENCGGEFATFSELEFDTEKLCRMCRDSLGTS